MLRDRCIPYTPTEEIVAEFDKIKNLVEKAKAPLNHDHITYLLLTNHIHINNKLSELNGEIDEAIKIIGKNQLMQLNTYYELINVIKKFINKLNFS